MKGNYSASPSFEPLNIRKSQIFLIDPLVLWDNKRLYLKTSELSIPWQAKTIINCTYSRADSLLFMLCEDWKLYVFTQNLEILTKFTWDSKYTVCFRYIESISSVLMIGVSEVELLKVKIVTNVKQTKFLSSMKCEVIKNKLIVADEKTKLKWHKGYDILPEENLLYVWSLQDIIFYKLDDLTLIVKIENITKKQVPLTKYIVIGYMNGQIKIWKIPHKNSEKRQIIHTFTYHTKGITNLIKSSDQRVFISQSADHKICLWNLDTFELVYCYDFLGIYEEIYLINHECFYAIKDEELGRCEFGKKLEFICNINNQVTFFDKYYDKPTLFEEKSKVHSIQFTLNSNLGFNLEMLDMLKTDVNKSNIQFFYPPLKSKGIVQIINCPFEKNRYYFLVENGQIYKTRIQNNSGKIQNLYVIQKIIDEESHQLNQQASMIKFLKIVPPRFDSEIIGKIYSDSQQNSKKSEEQLQKSYEEKQLIAIGCSKGAIVFLERNNFEKIFTRITYHRQAIVLLQSVYDKTTKQAFLVSMCSQRLLKVVRFEDGKSVCLQTIACEESLVNFKGYQNKLFCVFPKGIFQIFRITKEGQFFCIQNEESNDHEENIICLDVDVIKRIVLTAGIDHKIKIWDFYKHYIYQISMSEPINQAVLGNDINIIVAHNKKLSLIRKDIFNVSAAEIKHWKEQFLKQNNEKFELSKYVTKLKKKKRVDDHSAKKKKRTTENSRQLKPEEVPVDRSFVRQKNASKSMITTVKNRRKRTQSKKKTSDNYEKNKKKSEQQEIFKQDITALKNHITKMDEIKKTNLSLLPKIHNEKQSLFDEFMKAKLLNKKILTRRDITLNRIIMKNIIREYIGGDIVEGLNGVKVDQ